MNTKTRCFAPASIGNFIAGFDVLGLAIAPVDATVLGDEVTVDAAEQSSLQIIGDYADWVPNDKDNLVLQAVGQIHQWLKDNNYPRYEFNLTLDKSLPVGSGTGSSAASVVAAIQGLCGYLKGHYQIDIPMQARWKMMAVLEGGVSGGQHLDNLAPAVLGGLVLCPTIGEPQSLPFFDDWYLVVAYSGQRILTREGRACLPEHYSKADAILQMQRMGAIVHGLYQQDRSLVLAHLEDALAIPYRANLINDYSDCKAALLQQGALAVGISGSGPSFFAVTDNLSQANDHADWLRANLSLKNGGFVHVCQAWYP